MQESVTWVAGQLGHDVMNELNKRGHVGIGSDIAEIIMEVSGSEDVAVYIEGCHSCMSARGIKKQNAKTVTTTLRGAFDTDSTLKWHFMMQAGK
mgnify:CR=1 FL=1